MEYLYDYLAENGTLIFTTIYLIALTTTVLSSFTDEKQENTRLKIFIGLKCSLLFSMVSLYFLTHQHILEYNSTKYTIVILLVISILFLIINLIQLLLFKAARYKFPIYQISLILFITVFPFIINLVARF